MIVENDCLILQIFQMDDGETREEVPNGCDEPPAGPTRGTADASQPRGTGGAHRVGHARRWDRPAALRASPVPPLLALGTDLRRDGAIRGRDCPGEQGGPSGREPLPVRSLALPARHHRVAQRPPGPGSLEGAALPQSPPGTPSLPRR